MRLLSFDLGTGGVKASIYDENLNSLANSFVEYSTCYPSSYMHEQKPDDWWNGVVKSTRLLLSSSGTNPAEVSCIALSGHSLVTVPLDKEGRLLAERVPIWSDTRAVAETKEFFRKIPEELWYMTTGNGFPAPCYSIFKLMWLKKHEEELYKNIYKVLGSKDYINYKFTGKLYIDYSYASGTGAYDLKAHKMRTDFLEAAEIRPEIFPELVNSQTIVGALTREAAEETGLTENTVVACGGVDNACMALGAVGPEEGKIYTSLGSSSWVPINSKEPILDSEKRPYVFAHIQEDMYTSAFSIFAGGSSFRWAKEVLCKDIPDDVYREMDRLASTVPVGSSGIFFNPSLAGGTSQDKSINIRGAFIGLHLGTTREDMIRAVMEGICMNLKVSADYLMNRSHFSKDILFCGGGSKSKVWMQMFADVFNMNIVKTNIDQDAASLGAAAIAARGIGLWKDYSRIPSLHHIENISRPDPVKAAQYKEIQVQFEYISNILADLGDYMANRTGGTSNGQQTL